MTIVAFLPLMAALINLGLTFFVVSRRIDSTISRVYVLWGLALATWNVGTFQMFRVTDAQSALFWAKFLQCGVIFLPVSLAHLCWLIADMQVGKFIRWFYVLHVLLVVSNLCGFFVSGVRSTGYAYYSLAGPAFWVFVATYAVPITSLIPLYRKRRQLPALHQTRLTFMMIAVATLILFGINDTLPILGIYQYPFSQQRIFPLGSGAAILYGFLVGYSVLQHQLLDIHVTLSRFAAQAVRLVFVFALGFALLLLTFQFTPHLDAPVYYAYFGACLAVLAATVFIASTLFPRLFGVGGDQIERRILGDRFEYHDKINGYIQSVPWYTDADLLMDDLHDLLVKTVAARSYQLVLLDDQTRAFTLLRGHPNQTQNLPDFRPDSPVYKYFHDSRATYLALGVLNHYPGSTRLEADARSQLQPFDAELCFPFFADESLVGLLLLGRKQNAEPYTPHDLHLFSALVRNLNLVINQLRLKKQVHLAEEMELLGRMSRGMAHDLNNLITPVWTFLQLTREGLTSDAATDELLPTAIRNVETIRQYVKESLFYSTTLTPHFRVSRLHDCVTKAVELVQPQLRARNVVARIENLPHVEVEMDFVLIQRLLCNLLGNACDASPAGGQIEVRILPLAKTEVGRDWFRVLVTDHGDGISAENLKHIFRPYFTTKDRGTRRGFGLGLAICRKIVHLHGGNLNVESQLHKGTTVMMDLPNRQQEKPAAKPKPELVAVP